MLAARLDGMPSSPIGSTPIIMPGLPVGLPSLAAFRYAPYMAIRFSLTAYPAFFNPSANETLYASFTSPLPVPPVMLS